MSYNVTINGHVESAKQEAEIASKVADFIEEIGAKGYASFMGSHVYVSAAPADDAVAALRAKVAEYNAAADADDVATEDGAPS